MEKQTCTYGTPHTVNANAFTKKGYSFVGWNTKADGSGKTYKDCYQLTNGFTSKNGKIIKLYAQWKKK